MNVTVLSAALLLTVTLAFLPPVPFAVVGLKVTLKEQFPATGITSPLLQLLAVIWYSDAFPLVTVKAVVPRVSGTVPVLLTVYKDRSFTFIVKKPPASRLILKKLGLEKGSQKPQNKIAKLTKQQLEEIAAEKMEDLNAPSMDQAKKIIAGTARSMGIDADVK